MSFFEGEMPAADVVMCLVAVLFMAGILCTFFLPHTTRPHRHWRHRGSCCHTFQRPLAPQVPVVMPVNQETYIDNPPERSQEVVDRPVLQSPDKCKTDYDLCMASLGPVNQQTVLTNKPVRVISYPLDVISGAERRLAGQVPPMAPFPVPKMPTNVMTR